MRLWGRTLSVVCLGFSLGLDGGEFDAFLPEAGVVLEDVVAVQLVAEQCYL